MRRILIEKARQKCSRRRGEGRGRRELRDADLVASPLGDELLDLDEALTRLTAIDADAAVVAKRRLFVGMSVEQIAEIQQSSPRTVKRNRAQARAWLGRALAEPSRSLSTGRGRGEFMAPPFTVFRVNSQNSGRASSGDHAREITLTRKTKTHPTEKKSPGVSAPSAHGNSERR